MLRAVDERQPDEVWSLGDVIGYGPRPNPCCAQVSARADISLAGNHDLGVLGKIDLTDFSPDAAESALWSRGVLSDESASYLRPLEPKARTDGVELFHASAADPVWDYVLSGDAALETLELTESPLVLVGHSHVPLCVALADDVLSGGLAPEGTEVDLGTGRWLLNPGSVGQPRDGDPRAAYLMLDLGAGRATFHRVEYDIAKTQGELRERGLPEALAERLSRGV